MLQVAKHREVLDRFAGPQTLELLDKIFDVAKAYRQTEAKLKALIGDGREQQRRLEMLRFQLDEIAAAALQPDEEADLLVTRKRLSNYERLHNAVSKAYALLYQGSNGLPAVSDQLAEAVTELMHVERYDQELSTWSKTLQEALYNIEDIARSLRVYQESLTHDAGALQKVEQRLDLLNRLKRKYADSVEGVIAYSKTVAEEIMRIENSAELVASLQADLAKQAAIYHTFAVQLSEQRQQAAQALRQQMGEQLADLGLPHAVLAPEVRTAAESKPHPMGQDEVEFMFNANPGETPKQLIKVISGGEMSRVMLALKTLLAENDPVETLIFDEIDSGLGGRLALAVGEKLRELATSRQVICVSHLASIAAMADQHLFISKEIEEAATYTKVRVLEEQERVVEIARMLDGQMSEIALEHARELLKPKLNG